MTDLDNLIPPTRSLDIGGESIDVRPLRVGQLPAFTRAIAALLAAGESIDDPVDLVAKYPEEIAAATAVALDRPRDWVDARELDQMVDLVAAIIEVNADFFVRRVLPKMEAASGRITALLGPIASKGSSATATAGTTS